MSRSLPVITGTRKRRTPLTLVVIDNMQMKKLIILLVSFSCYSTVIAGTANLSGIVVEWVEYPYSQKCHGTIGNNAKLKDIGITKSEIKNGINCVAGDFDGNGYLDFLLFGKYIDLPPVIPHPENYLAVLYNKKEIINQLIVKHPKLSHPFLYKARDIKGEFGEPASKTDGFIEPGEGGTTVIFLYNKKTKKFDISEHASEYN